MLAADFEEGAVGPVARPQPSPRRDDADSAQSAGTTPPSPTTASTLQLYLNGVLEAAAIIGRPARADSIEQAAIGTALNSTGVAAGFFAGTVDEARIWNYARTAAQIASGKDREIASANGLLGRWGFNECCRPQDSSGQNATGTLFGSAWAWVAGGPLTGAINAAPVVSGGRRSVDHASRVRAALRIGHRRQPQQHAGVDALEQDERSGDRDVRNARPPCPPPPASRPAGTYVLTLTASDGELSGTDSVTIEVGFGTPNLAPVVNAGPDQITTVALGAALAGSVTDDGQPGGDPEHRVEQGERAGHGHVRAGGRGGDPRRRSRRPGPTC